MSSSPDILGVVLCGGQSTRMGRDKGLIPQGNTIWSAKVRSVFHQLSMSSVISVNAQQYQEYSMHFEEENLIVDSELVNGPLNGLLSVHKKFPDTDLLLLATDMVHINPNTVQTLMGHYDGKKPICWKNDAFKEPFCAIYPAKVLTKVVSFISEIDYSPGLKMILNEFDAVVIEASDEEKKALVNYNSLD